MYVSFLKKLQTMFQSGPSRRVPTGRGGGAHRKVGTCAQPTCPGACVPHRPAPEPSASGTGSPWAARWEEPTDGGSGDGTDPLPAVNSTPPLQVRLPLGAEGCLPKGPRLPGPRAPGECHGAGQGPPGAAVARDKGFWEEAVLRVRPGCLPSRCRGERAGKGPVPLGSEREGDRSHRSPGGRGETDGAGTGEGKQPNRGGANSLRPPGRWDGGGEGATGAQGFVTNESPEPGRRSLPPAGAPGPAPAAAARGRPHASSKPARPTSPAGCYSN